MQLLSKAGLVTGGRGLYNISEDIFWKGDAKTRAALLNSKTTKITIEPNDDFELQE